MLSMKKNADEGAGPPELVYNKADRGAWQTCSTPQDKYC